MTAAVIQSSILLSLALCAVVLLRRQSAAVRHTVLAAGMVSSVAVPFLGALLPRIEFAPGSQIYARVQDQTELFLKVSPVPRVPLVESTRVPSPIHPFLLWTWFAGMVVAGSVFITGGSRIVLLLSRSTTNRNTRWLAATREVRHVMGLKRSVQLIQNDSGILGAWGVLRPKVFLPKSAESWTASRIRVVLIHELAHIKRFDWPLQMLAQLARAVYWFNPLFWFACRWLRAESEQACDDVVLNSGVDAQDYAADLLDLARMLNNSSRPWSSVLAMSRPPNLERRFVAMLNPSLNRRRLTRVGVFAIWVVAGCITLQIAALRGAERRQQDTPASTHTAPPKSSPTSRPPAQIASSAVAKYAVPRPARRQGLADGSLWGTVYDGTGAVVPGVTVTVSNERIAEQITTGSAGEYEFRALLPGRYLLTAGLQGFMTANISGIEIKSAQVSRQSVTLSVGRIAERVTVSVAGQPKPLVTPGTPQRIRVGGNVQAANLISQVRPIYPQIARDSGIEGTVHLQGIIGADGTLIGLRVISSNDPDLAGAALEAVTQWRYRPTLLNNVPVEVITEIDVDFKLVQ